MSKKKSIIIPVKPPKVSDLVYHVLYGPSWLGILLNITEDEKYCKEGEVHMVGLVHIIPNTKHSDYFDKALKRYRVCDNMGYVSMRWLRSILKSRFTI